VRATAIRFDLVEGVDVGFAGGLAPGQQVTPQHAWQAAEAQEG